MGISKYTILAASLFACGCGGGGGGSESSSSTTVNQCTFDVEKGEVAEIVQAAEDSGAEVVDNSSAEDTSEVSEPVNNDLQGDVIRISGTIVSGCGSEINANETENNVTQAQRLKKLIFAGEVIRLEVQ